MTALEEARSVVGRLSVPERQALLEWIYREPVQVGPGIFRTPGVCGGEARIRQTRIAVWLLEEGRRNGATDAQLLEMHPTLAAEDLTNAWNYVAGHGAEIDRVITENQET